MVRVWGSGKAPGEGGWPSRIPLKEFLGQRAPGLQAFATLSKSNLERRVLPFPNLSLLESGPGLSRTTDTGLLVIVAALFLTAILAHRLWRGKIRAEDELMAFRRDAAFSAGRYRAGFRKLQSVAAFADRATGLVVEPTPGWVAKGLAAGGRKVWGDDATAEASWQSIPPPDAENHVGAPVRFTLAGHLFEAEPLDRENLGLVLVQEIQ